MLVTMLKGVVEINLNTYWALSIGHCYRHQHTVYLLDVYELQEVDL